MLQTKTPLKVKETDVLDKMCQSIRDSGTTEENHILSHVLQIKYWRRDNTETVS